MMIEGRLLWGEDVIVAVAHVAPRELVRLADFGLPIPGDDQLIVSALWHGRPILLDEDGVCARPGANVTIVREGVALHLRLVDANAEKMPRDLGDLRLAHSVAFGAVLHATLLLLAFFVRMTSTEEEAASLRAMKAWSEALEAREPQAADPEPGAGDAPRSDEPGTPTQARDPGGAGTVASQNRDGVTQRARGQQPQDLRAPRRAEAALAFGMIGIVTTTGGGTSSGKSAFADYEGPSATGTIFGTTIEDATGASGATLSGWGSGGGGLGEGIGINGVSGMCDAKCRATRGTVGGVGGRGVGLGRGHATRSPSLRCGYEVETGGRVGCEIQINGRLPPEAIQRVVRQSFGRLRGCYESGLLKNPRLEGRIAVKFVIDREGAVSTASATDHDLADDEVVSCVARGFQRMSFPPPSGGIVTVVYPVVFSS